MLISIRCLPISIGSGAFCSMSSSRTFPINQSCASEPNRFSGGSQSGLRPKSLPLPHGRAGRARPFVPAGEKPHPQPEFSLYKIRPALDDTGPVEQPDYAHIETVQSKDPQPVQK